MNDFLSVPPGVPIAEYKTAGTLDPLGADSGFPHLPRLNAERDVGGLVGFLRAILPSERRVAELTPEESVAAMRDLGMLLGSLKRHGVEPIEVAPEIERPLLELAAKSGMVPRDTVYHYGPFNPRGPRQRRFTGDANEDGLIECVRSAAPQLESAIGALLELLALSCEAPEFSAGIVAAARSAEAMVDAIDFAKRNVDVVFFARVLRPYFEPVTIAGRSYHGPAAAHLPLCLVDHLLWGSDCEDPVYRHFQEETLEYTVPRWRELYRRHQRGPSIATRLLAALAADDGSRRFLDASAAIQILFRVIIKFRGRHKVMADRAYDVSVRTHAVGSGGYSTDFVGHLLGLTKARAQRFRCGGTLAIDE